MLNDTSWQELLQKAPHRLQEWIEANGIKSNTPIFITRGREECVLFIVDCTNESVTLARPGGVFGMRMQEYIPIDQLIFLLKK